MGLNPTGGIEVRVRGIGAGGVGIGDLPDGRVVFLPRTAPGDLVRVTLVQEKSRWARGELMEVLEEGDGRQVAPCPRYGECHGCALQHLEYSRQLLWKGRIVGDALRRIGGLASDDPEVEPSPRELAYRNKATMTLRRLAGGRVVAGFHQLSDRKRILDLGPECLLLIPGLARLWGDLRSAWGPDADLLPQGRELRLTLRAGEDGGALLVRGGWGEGRPEALLAAVPGLASVWREEKDGGVRLLAGKPALHLSWLGESLEVTGGAFVQVNQEGGEALHRFVLEEVGAVEGRTIIEGYCGAGVLGRKLAFRGARVLGIESDPLGVAEARRGAPEGFQVVQGRVEELLADHLPADLVILNPPRAGLEARIPEALASDPVESMVYVSCDPATLARDLARLGDAYGMDGVRSFDLFPQTGHVETVVFLRRRSG
jgi:23S rRNA (uracil1939-C5)-methyltransferase